MGAEESVKAAGKGLWIGGRESGQGAGKGLVVGSRESGKATGKALRHSGKSLLLVGRVLGRLLGFRTK
jgi:hypothetical protein